MYSQWLRDSYFYLHEVLDYSFRDEFSFISRETNKFKWITIKH